MKNIEKLFESFVSVETTSDVLKAGKHIVKLIMLTFMHSFLNYDGSEKEKNYDYSDPNPQLGVLFGNENGTIFHRFAMLGYDRYEELEEKDKKSGKWVCSADGYAMNAKTLKRKENAKRTADCRRILSRLFHAFELPAGSTIKDLQAMKDSDKTITIEIVEKEGIEGTYLEVAKIYKTRETVDIADEAFDG